MTYRKFFDKDGKEVAPEDAVKFHEIVTDDNGKVIRDSWFILKNEEK